jgi:AraC-like DNA-binding protein
MVWRSNILSTTKKTSAATSSDIDAVIAMSKFIFGNLEAVLNSQQVAKAVGLHPNYAMRIFKKIAGMTIQEYVVAHRVSTAQRLLLTDSEPIEIVGKRSGFQSTSQYYAVFKQQTGLSPLQYRKKYAA